MEHSDIGYKHELTPQYSCGVKTLLLILGICSFLVFFNAINHPFVHDDIVFIVQNPQISHLEHWEDIFLHPNIAASDGINAYYRPILEVFYRLEYQLFGFDASGFHLANVLIHMANGFLIFLLLSYLRLSKWFAFGVSLLFLIHPVQTEAVACVAGVSNLLSTLFVLLTLYAYVQEKYFLLVVSFILALLTKEQVIVIPLLFVLLDWYHHRRNRYGLWFCFVLMILGFLALRANITGSHMLQDILQSPGELRLRILAIPRTLLMYLRLLVFPCDLHYYRNTDILAPNGLGFIILGSLSVVLVWLVKKFQESSREIIFGMAWFIICLLPVLNVLPLINEYSFILTADHFLYLPIVGIVIAGGAIARQIIPFQKLIVVGGLVCLILGLQSVYQNTFWRGEIPLFERMIHFEPNFGRGQLLLAKAYFSNKQEDLALEHYQRALSIMKGYRKKSANARASQFYDGFIKDINYDIAQCYLAKPALQASSQE